MQFIIKKWSLRCGWLLLAVILLAGCAAGQAEFKQGEEELSAGDYDQAVASFLTAVEKNPGKYSYQLKFNVARNKASQEHKYLGDKFFAESKYLEARNEYQMAVDLNGSNFAADEALQRTVKYLQAQKLIKNAEELIKARRKLQAKAALEEALKLVNDYQPALRLKKELEQAAYALIDGVELEVTSTEPITLNFKNAKLPDVFEILTNLSGINFILDEDIRSNNTTLFLEQATFAQALELLLQMNKLDKKILNSKTIILFPKTRDKQKQFEDQLIQTFYLSNIDAKKAVNLLRTMLQVRKIYVHEELNAIIIRDTSAVIKLAAKILEANDRGDAEVVFDLELIEVNHNDTRQLGLKLSNYQVSAGLGLDGATTLVNSGLEAGGEIAGLVPAGTSAQEFNTFYTLPTATFRLMKTQVDAEVLASPKIRVKNKEKAKVHIGSREPVITVTINGDQTSENVQYVDVGVKLDVEPSIQLDNTIVTKVGLEVSNVSGRERTTSGTAVLTISTTNANTALTLKDGEQTIIGGLIRDDKSVTKNKIPILGDIPILGELFTGTDTTDSKREILLSITPHIVKSVVVPDQDVASIWSGGEDDLKFGRNFGTFADEYAAGQKGLEPEVQSPAMTPDAESTPNIAEPSQIPAVDEKSSPPLDQEPLPEPPTVPETAAEVPPVTRLQPPSGEPQLATPPEPQVAATELPTEQPVSQEIQPLIYVRGSELVKVGEIFTLSFYVDEINNLFSAPLYVQYDEDKFDFVTATEGDFLQRGEAPTVFTHTALAGSGRIIVGLKQGAGGQGVSGAGELFTMSFKAKQAGLGMIEPTRTNFRNPQGVRLQTNSFGLKIEAQ